MKPYNSSKGRAGRPARLWRTGKYRGGVSLNPTHVVAPSVCVPAAVAELFS